MLLGWSSGQTARELLDCENKFEKLYQAATDGLTARLLTSVPGHNAREEQERRKARDERQRREAREAYKRQRERRPEVSTFNRFDALTMEDE